MHLIHIRQAPRYLIDCLFTVSAACGRYRLTSTDTADYVLPQTRANFGERGFCYSSTAAWKSISSHLHDLTNTNTFTSMSVFSDPHMPILHPHTAWFHERRISSMTFTSAHLYSNVYIRVGVACALADSSDAGVLGQQSSQKWEIPCLVSRRTAVQNLTPLALSLTEKYVTVQTNKQ